MEMMSSLFGTRSGDGDFGDNGNYPNSYSLTLVDVVP